jgi:hypothetical protein
MKTFRLLFAAQMLTIGKAASAALGTARGTWSQSICSASRRMLAAAALGVLALPAAHAGVSAELWVGFPERRFPDLWAGETGFLGESYGYKLFRSEFMQPTTYASVEGNLSAGTMRAVAQTDYFKSSFVSPGYPPGYFDSMTSAGARVNMADTFTFNNLTFGQVQMGYLDIQVSGSFISPPDASPGRILYGTGFVGASVSSSDRQVYLSRSQWFAANEYSGPGFQTASPGQVGSSVSYFDTLSFQLLPGTTYSVGMSLDVIATGLDADFGSTARAYLRLPEGVTYTSQSGVFLATAVPLSPVPLPPAAWLMLAGLGTLGVRLRKTY